MADWDPEQYMRFRQDRLRPAYELLARVRSETPETIVDLGCGPATSTKLLVQRYKQAKIIGVDNSVDMIGRARDELHDVEFVVADIAKWNSLKKVDMFFANAVFHWLPDHEGLISRLAEMLNPSGVLALQIPDNMNEPSHRVMTKLVQSHPWNSIIADQANLRTPIACERCYYNWLARDFEQIDIWRTIYTHVMPSHEHIVEWMKGAALTQYLGNLDNSKKAKFLDAYSRSVRISYPEQADGSVLFRFPRLFIVAKKSG